MKISPQWVIRVWILNAQEGVIAICCNSVEMECMILNSTVVEQDWLPSSILFKPTQFAKKSCSGTWPCTLLLLLSPDWGSAEEPAGVEGFRRADLCVLPHTLLPAQTAIPLCCLWHSLYKCHLTLPAHSPSGPFQERAPAVHWNCAQSLELLWVQLTAGVGTETRRSVLCGLNRSSWLCWAGLLSSRSFGACHSCTVQLLARPEVLQGGQGCSVCWKKPRDQPQQMALETGAPLGKRCKIHRGALCSKPAHGTMLALFICWFWLVHSWMAPGSTGTEVSAGSMSLPLQGVRQTHCQLSPPVRPGLSKLSVIISVLCWPQTLNPCSQGVSSLLMEMSLPCILMSCWAVNAGHMTNCECSQPVKPDFKHGF